MRRFHLLLALVAALSGAACTTIAGDAEWLGSYHWKTGEHVLGGFSGIELSPDGNHAILLSDRALLVEALLSRDAAGLVNGVEVLDRAFLRNADGARLHGKLADSEGLALGPDGTLWISFEDDVRVTRQQGLHGLPETLPRHPDFAEMQSNAALESVAIGPDGAIYTIPERSGRATWPFPVYRFLHGTWDIPFTLARRGAFLVSDADIGPDGRLYILERDFAGFGFRTRVRSFALDGSDEREHFTSRLGSHDNLEGLAVSADGQGIRLTMISDDNQNLFQRTEIVEYLIAE